jgi:FlaA1/EpsC-like NDP-sugar epimerase
MRNRYVFVADLAAIAVAAIGAFVLRFDWQFLQARPEFLAFLLAAVAIKPAVFYGFGLYRRYWRYASIRDMNAVVLATAAASAVMGVFVTLAIPLHVIAEFSRALLVIDCMLTLLVTGGLRLSIRVVAEARGNGRERRLNPADPGSKRILVAGAGNAGTLVVREVERNPQLGLQLVGFLDDDIQKLGKRIYGLPVLGDLGSLARVSKACRVNEVIIAMPTASGATLRSVVERCQELGLRSRTIPGVFELLDGKVSVSRLRHVEITDLLRRRQVPANPDSNRYLAGRTVLVTGAGGSIGFELCRQVAHAAPTRLIMLGHGENSLFEADQKLRETFPDVSTEIVVADIRDRSRIERVFAEWRPEVVFHAAAHKHVHLMEANPEEAVSNNVVGTFNLVQTALASRTERFVAISTDKAVCPAGIMGASKRMAGMIVRDAARRSGRAFVVVRFGNVLGSRGSVVPFFKSQIEKGGPVTITDPDMKRYFMTISEAVHLVLEAGGMGKGGELFVLNMGQSVRIMDLAKDLIRLSGYTTEQIPIVVSGARRGEKMEERLWESDAAVEPTTHSDILKVTEPENSNGNDLAETVRALEMAAEVGDRTRVEAILCEWIPTFTPSMPELRPLGMGLGQPSLGYPR